MTSRRQPTHISEARSGLVFRVVDRGPEHVVVRFPFWVSDRALDKAIDALCKDAQVCGRHITAKRGHRLVRFEEPRSDQSPPIRGDVMDLFILYTYQSQSHGTEPNEPAPAPTDVCHAYLFLTQADAEAAAPAVEKVLVNGFTVPGSFGAMVLPLETTAA